MCYYKGVDDKLQQILFKTHSDTGLSSFGFCRFHIPDLFLFFKKKFSVNVFINCSSVQCNAINLRQRYYNIRSKSIHIKSKYHLVTDRCNSTTIQRKNLKFGMEVLFIFSPCNKKGFSEIHIL